MGVKRVIFKGLTIFCGHMHSSLYLIKWYSPANGEFSCACLAIGYENWNANSILWL